VHMLTLTCRLDSSIFCFIYRDFDEIMFDVEAEQLSAALFGEIKLVKTVVKTSQLFNF